VTTLSTAPLLTSLGNSTHHCNQCVLPYYCSLILESSSWDQIMSLPAAYKDPVTVSPPYVCRALPLALYVLRKIIYVLLCRAREHNSSMNIVFFRKRLANVYFP
jgi:hypothetical protein